MQRALPSVQVLLRSPDANADKLVKNGCRFNVLDGLDTCFALACNNFLDFPSNTGV